MAVRLFIVEAQDTLQAEQIVKSYLQLNKAQASIMEAVAKTTLTLLGTNPFADLACDMSGSDHFDLFLDETNPFDLSVRGVTNLCPDRRNDKKKYVVITDVSFNQQ
jgi:hypothetical protein